jgi:hypothetical protein
MPGPLPKPDAERVRGKKSNPLGLKTVSSRPAKQPPLPKAMPNGEDWPTVTRTWWRTWRNWPLSDEYTVAEWSFLLDTAAIHGAFWSGELGCAAELRMRAAKFGVTPEDRARLRIVFAAADEAEKPKPQGKTARYDGLKSTGGGNAVARAELSA